MVKKILLFLFRPFLGKTFFQKFYFYLLLLSLKGMNFGGGAFPGQSGEEYVIQIALTKLKKDNLTIFDVGANKGDYTEIVLKNLAKGNKQATLWLFEPAVSLFERLKSVFSQNKTVKIFPLALSDRSGEGVLYSDSEGSGLASLVKRNMDFAGIEFKREEKISTITLDEFCVRQGVDEIDFLKLDVEGFEFLVLQGAKNLLDKKKIRYIQFEFGGTNIDTRIFFKDFYYLLEKKYHLYRILQNGLWPIENYSELDEIFITTNYLAVLKD